MSFCEGGDLVSKVLTVKAILLSVSCVTLWAVVCGSVRGVVHDPDHRPVIGALVALKSVSSDYSRTVSTGEDGGFEDAAIPVGAYRVTVTYSGFAPIEREVVVASGSAPYLHFQLQIGAVAQSLDVNEAAETVDTERATPIVMVSRREIAATPGADLSNSFNMITDLVPGAWMTHDQLHVRGGHQVTWAIDGVPIPNTNIASNVGPQIDPKDIDYVEAERGGYSSAYGDRTYAVFDVVPRTGFEANREGELYTTFGTFGQTNDQVNFGSHTRNFAYFASVNGYRADYGLETPGPDVWHDRDWGLGGMATFIYNRDANNQFRFVTSLRRDNYQIPNDPAARAAGIDDVERERDALGDFSWLHTFSPGLLLTVSPFYHYNLANYDGGPNDYPLGTTQHRTSRYAGLQSTLNRVTARHNASVGIYQFGQWDRESVNLVAHDGSAPPLAVAQRRQGNLEAVFLEDQFKAFSWLTLTAGLRLTHFAGAISENAANPRLGGSVRIPHLNWVLRASWGSYYQAPPLSTVTGPLLDYASSEGLGFIPLHGERDQEHEFGLTVPWRGWLLDVGNYHQRARNYFDHNNIGNSNVFFPLTVDGARLYGWEVTVRSPRLARRGQIHLSYADAHAEGAGAISGGLTDFSPPASGYFLLDHDQRHTLHTGFSFDLPMRLAASSDVYYGSGFTDGASPAPAHLPGHTTFDLALSRAFSEAVTVSLVGLNVANRRFLLDNSATFGGTHYAAPREIYAQIRYRFHW
jgi:hypothetical protein